MNLIELVKYFRKGGTYEEFCQENGLNFESEVIEIYTTKPYKLENDLAFFEIEKTEGKIEYHDNDKTYFNLFDFYFFQDAIEESHGHQNSSLPDETIAQKLFNYGINDA